MKKFDNFNVTCRKCGSDDSKDVNCKIVTRRVGGAEEEMHVIIYCKCGNKEDLT